MKEIELCAGVKQQSTMEVMQWDISVHIVTDLRMMSNIAVAALILVPIPIFEMGMWRGCRQLSTTVWALTVWATGHMGAEVMVKTATNHNGNRPKRWQVYPGSKR